MKSFNLRKFALFAVPEPSEFDLETHLRRIRLNPLLYYREVPNYLKNLPEIQKTYKNAIIAHIKNDPQYFNELPQKFKSNQEFINAAIEGWENLFIDSDSMSEIRFFLTKCPFKNLDRIKYAAELALIEKFNKKPINYYYNLPPYLMKRKDIKTKYKNELMTALRDNPLFIFTLSQEFIKDKDVLNAWEDGVNKIMKNNPEAFPFNTMEEYKLFTRMFPHKPKETTIDSNAIDPKEMATERDLLGL